MVAGKKLFISAACVGFLTSCGGPEETTVETPIERARAYGPGEQLLNTLAPADWADAAGKFIDTSGNEIGFAVLTDAPGAGMLMRVDLKGLDEGWHGIHLHQIGDCSDYSEGFKASGGHIDPDDREHGLLNPAGSERADIPNIYADNAGRATAEIYRRGVALLASEQAAAEAGPHPLADGDGFAIVVHTNADDHMTQPIGGAGARVACAAITGG